MDKWKLGALWRGGVRERLKVWEGEWGGLRTLRKGQCDQSQGRRTIRQLRGLGLTNNRCRVGRECKKSGWMGLVLNNP